MSQFRGDINKLTSPELPNSISNWINLLSFFNQHKDDLDIRELNILVIKSENFRHVWNETHTDRISKQEVQPNICEYVDCLKVTLYSRAE